MYDRNGETGPQLHLSSVTSPRTFNTDGNKIDLNGTESQGSLVSVYNDRIIVSGIDFKNGKVLSYATYCFNKTVPTETDESEENKTTVTVGNKTDKKQNDDKTDKFDIKIVIIIASVAVIIALAVIIILIIVKHRAKKNL